MRVPWIRIEEGTLVRHRQVGYEGLIEGITYELCRGPKRNPDRISQYRIRREGRSNPEYVAEEDLEVVFVPPSDGARNHSVYVVLLAGVPDGTGKDVYVGMTGLTPKERFARHKRGYQAGRGYVRDYGVRLLPELYEDLNPLTWEEAQRVESKDLPLRLRAMGYKVYGGH